MRELLSIFRAPDTRRFDWHLIFFFLNVVLVILGYSTRGATFQLVKIARIALIGASFFALFFYTKRAYYFHRRKDWVLWGFVLLNMYALGFSLDFSRSLSRFVTWLPFVIYIDFFVVYLFQRYDKQIAKNKILQIFNLSYVYPLFILFVFANPFILRNIYGKEILGFKNNVFGWTAVMFFVTAVDALSNTRPKGLYRFFLLSGTLFALYVMYISGSRSSYLCVALTLVIIVFNSKQVRFYAKVIVSILIVGSTVYMLQDPESAINKRLEKTETQLEKGESRFEMAEIALSALADNPEALLTGFGFDHFREGVAYYTGVILELRSHNTYLELLTTTGIFVFLFFFFFMLLNAILKYAVFDMRKYVFLPTVLIIPFFESNLNAGQFLFFPWVFSLFYYVHYRSAQIPMHELEQLKQAQPTPKPTPFIHLIGN